MSTTPIRHLVKVFLKRGADPIEADAETWATPLAWAVTRNHPDIAADLRSAGAR